jgi:hypothetical protein
MQLYEFEGLHPIHTALEPWFSEPVSLSPMHLKNVLFFIVLLNERHS